MFKIRTLFIGILFLVGFIELNAGKGDASNCLEDRLKTSQRNACKTDFHNAAIDNNPIKIVQLIDSGTFHPDARESLSGETALHKAAFYGSMLVAHALLSNGALILYKKGMTETFTPVYMAVLKKNTSILALLWHICRDDELFDAPNKITGLRPSELAQEKWGTTLEALVKEGEDEIDNTFEDVIREIVASRKDAFRMRKINEFRPLTSYKIDLAHRTKMQRNLAKDMESLERTRREREAGCEAQEKRTDELERDLDELMQTLEKLI